MKRILVILVIMALVLSMLVACTPKEEVAVDESVTDESVADESDAGVTSDESGQEENAEKKPLKIFMTNAYYTAPYCAPLNASATETAEKMGAELQIVDGEANAQKQLDQMKTAVTEGVDGIIYFPADAASTPPVVDFLNESGVPYIILNTTVDESVADQITCYVGSDFFQHGINIGIMVKEVLGNEGNIVIVEGAGGSNFTIQVTDALADELSDTDITILAAQQADWDPAKAMKITEDYLTKYGDEIDLVVSQDGGMLQGVLSALDAAGLLGDMPVVCAGSNQPVADAIAAGYVYGTSTQDPNLEAELAVETLIKLINGEDIDDWVKLPMFRCTKDDLDKYNWF